MFFSCEVIEILLYLMVCLVLVLSAMTHFLLVRYTQNMAAFEGRVEELHLDKGMDGDGWNGYEKDLIVDIFRWNYPEFDNPALASRGKAIKYITIVVAIALMFGIFLWERRDHFGCG